MSKITESYRDWVDKIPYALWGCHTSVQTSSRATPYSLVYGMEVVLLVELEIPSLRIILESKVSEEDWHQSHLNELSLLDERRLKTLYHIQRYHRRIA